VTDIEEIILKSVDKVPVKDNEEPLVNLKQECPNVIIAIHPQSRKLQKLPEGTAYLRKGAARRLRKAQQSLARGYHLVIWEAHRPLNVQKDMYNKYHTYLKTRNPTWSEDRLESETRKFVAPPKGVPPHSTGGTVDLSIIGPDKNELDMGTKYLKFDEKTHMDFEELDEQVKLNRIQLTMVMEDAGFVNYPLEWWHWSYGDKYWAHVSGKRFSIYGSCLPHLQL
jgi:D-alanyl-D-alanine dipeptidase